jgi:phage terminase large subunit-like protein
MGLLSPTERHRLFHSLPLSVMEALEFEWQRWWARPRQIAPPGDWSQWALIAGRGFGKTRIGAEWVRSLMCGDTPLTGGSCSHLALVAETAADAREVMIGDGKPMSDPWAGSGLLQVHPPDFRPTYEPSKRRVTWPNGSVATIYNATEPDQLRGPQHGAAWCDELAKWRYAQETYDQLEFGLRIGNPRICITTTPRPIKLLKTIINDPGTVLTTGATYENAANLADKFIIKIVRKYEGTRLGRQELLAEILEDVPFALWQRSVIDALRVNLSQVPQLIRIVVAIDPGTNSQGDDPDETGIIAAGLAENGHAYVLDDVSKIYAPIEWAREAIRIYQDRRADRIVAEVNNGGEMVETTLRMVDSSVAYSPVWASRGKAIRAEPISALYEQGKVHHVGAFATLEDQMCAFTSDFDRDTAGYSPDRMDALVWALTELKIQGGGREFNFG